MSGSGASLAGPSLCMTEFERDKSHLYAGEKQDRLWERRSGGGSDATKATRIPDTGRHFRTYRRLELKGHPSVHLSGKTFRPCGSSAVFGERHFPL